MKRQAFNPYLTEYEYIPDGEPYLFGDRVYVYGSHDRFGAPMFCMNDYVCWSAPADDLSDWRYEGVIYRKNQDPKNRLGIRLLFAPDVARGMDGKEDESHASNYIGNTHGGILHLNGKYYIFYHRHTNRSSYARQACAEEITMDENGMFRQAEMTSCGLNGGPLKGVGTYPARIACNLWSKDGTGRYDCKNPKKAFAEHPYFTQDKKDGDGSARQYIANMRDGAVAGFKYFVMGEAKEISVKLAGKAKGKMLVSGNRDFSAINAEIPVENLNNVKTDFTAKLIAGKGKRALYFEYKGEGYVDFISFTLK